MLTRQLFILIVFFSISTFSLANKSTRESNHLQHFADQYLHDHGQEEHFTALALTLQTAKDITPISVYTGTMGTNSTKHINKNSLFQVGSITKSFIAAILLQLENDPQNNFSIEDSITKYFPQYSKWHAITVKELMNMSSGIPDYFTDDAIITGYSAHPFLHYRPRDWINRIYNKPLIFKPGSAFSYSNSNYFILGMLIEKLTGHTVSYEINARIIKPLQLKHTYFITHQIKASLSPYLVHGYQYQDGFTDYIPLGADVTDYSLSYMNAAGALISNSEDMAKWTETLFTPGKFLNLTEWNKMVAVISETTGKPINKLTPSDRDGYGLGIGAQFRRDLNVNSYIYFGMTFGYRAIYLYIPERKTTITITVNSSYDVQKNHLLDLVNKIAHHTYL